jgi:hypothetical protein
MKSPQEKEKRRKGDKQSSKVTQSNNDIENNRPSNFTY